MKLLGAQRKRLDLGYSDKPNPVGLGRPPGLCPPSALIQQTVEFVRGLLHAAKCLVPDPVGAVHRVDVEAEPVVLHSAGVHQPIHIVHFDLPAQSVILKLNAERNRLLRGLRAHT